MGIMMSETCWVNLKVNKHLYLCHPLVLSSPIFLSVYLISWATLIEQSESQFAGRTDATILLGRWLRQWRIVLLSWCRRILVTWCSELNYSIAVCKSNRFTNSFSRVRRSHSSRSSDMYLVWVSSRWRQIPITGNARCRNCCCYYCRFVQRAKSSLLIILGNMKFV